MLRLASPLISITLFLGPTMVENPLYFYLYSSVTPPVKTWRGSLYLFIYLSLCIYLFIYPVCLFISPAHHLSKPYLYLAWEVCSIGPYGTSDTLIRYTWALSPAQLAAASLPLFSYLSVCPPVYTVTFSICHFHFKTPGLLYLLFFSISGSFHYLVFTCIYLVTFVFFLYLE